MNTKIVNRSKQFVKWNVRSSFQTGKLKNVIQGMKALQIRIVDLSEAQRPNQANIKLVMTYCSIPETPNCLSYLYPVTILVDEETD